MRTMVHLRGPALPHQQRPELAEIYPDGFDSLGYFTVWLPSDDPRIVRIQHWLEVRNYRAWNKWTPRIRDVEYDLTLVRKYDDADYDRAEYLELSPDISDHTISDVDRDEHGRLRLRRKSVKSSKLDFGRAVLGYIVVPERVKTILEAQDLKHLAFKPTVAVKGIGLAEERCTPMSWESVGIPPWWELTSDLTLPPLSPSMDLRDDLGNHVTREDAAMGCVPKDGFYNHPELHYRRADLAQAERFDVARTFESFGPRSPIQRPSIIVSQRFYQTCARHGLKTEWVPVRVDED